ncbi:unnamed protein product, partial [marine sediment metagenome]
SPKAVSNLVFVDSIDGTSYSKFYQDVSGKETLIYLFDSKNTAIFISWSFPSGSLEDSFVDSHIKTIFKSANIPILSVSGIDPKTGLYNNFYLGLMDTPEGKLSGNGCYDDKGKFIILINNSNAVNPTYSQLVSFLQSDKTDQYLYKYVIPPQLPYYGSAESHVDLKHIQDIIDGTIQPSDPNICADFAERLHNNAEKAGIRCAYVSVDISGYSDPYGYGIPSDTSHALVAFNTTDKGLVYIDDTGISSYGPSSCDKIVDV